MIKNDDDVMTGGISRRTALGLLMALGASPAFAAGGADDYPDQYIRLILPFPPGGGTDTLSRIIGAQLKNDLGQAIIVDNRPGAAGNIATLLAAKAPHDGYTLLMGFNTALVVNPAIYPDLSVNIETAFEPISLIAEAEYVLVVNPSLPIHSVKDLADYAKTNPGKLNYSSSGIGGPLHLAGALFAAEENIDIVHLPFKGGSPAVLAVLNGEAQMNFGSIASTVPNIKAGKLRPLAVSGMKRSTALPDLPTLDESGLPGFNVTSWYGVLAPAGTPKPIISKLHDNLVKTLSAPDVKKSMEREGLAPIGSTPEELAQRIKDDTASWAELIKKLNLKVQ
jgi:tripartite-type tricarboxylate transporter receptor subunit TctC